jgi:hypothetical protein
MHLRFVKSLQKLNAGVQKRALLFPVKDRTIRPLTETEVSTASSTCFSQGWRLVNQGSDPNLRKVYQESQREYLGAGVPLERKTAIVL